MPVVSNITNAQLAQKISDLVNSWRTYMGQQQAWLAGTVGGGPSSDGKYPLTDSLGNTYNIESPAQLAADVTTIVGSATAQATAAAASATAAAASATTATTQATNAATSAATATTKATAASTAASLAGSYAAAAGAASTAAAASATAAATSEANAATSATAAAASATAASTSATGAAASAAAAAASAILAATFTPSLYALLAGAHFTGAVGIGATPDSQLFVLGANGCSLRVDYSGVAGDNYYDASRHNFRTTAGTPLLTITPSYSTYAWNSGGFSAGVGGITGLVLNNLSSTMQTGIEWQKSGAIIARLRADYVGNLNYVTELSGNHNFFVNGDSGAGTIRMAISGGTGPLVQVLGGGSGTTSVYAGAGRAVLQLNGSSDSLLDLAINGSSVGYLYGASSEMRLNGAGTITFYPSGVETGYWTHAGAGSGGAPPGLVNLGSYQRSAAGAGFLDGNYAAVETGGTSGAIYSIGGGVYVPGTTTLGNMYGIGYTLGNVSGIASMGQAAHWGMYVASGGTGNIFFDSDSGIGYAVTAWAAGGKNCTRSNDATVGGAGGLIKSQSGGSPSGGNDGDIIFIY